MQVFRVKKSNRQLRGVIDLERSKSISNRVLIIQALCEADFEIKGLSQSDDTKTLKALLESDASTLDVGAAGTTMRFLTAFMATQEGREVVMTGSERMQNRPIQILVDALQSLGAEIAYEAKDGYPPHKIKGNANLADQVSLKGNVSSQFISALLLIAPVLKNGLKLTLEGEIVSIPYIQMTLSIMEYFGIDYTWEGNEIHVPAQKYQAKDFEVEADWSGASYWYLMAALSDDLHLEIKGLTADSLQGDSVLYKWMEDFGVHSTFNGNTVTLTKSDQLNIPSYLDFILCPDIAQTFACIYAALGKSVEFDGLKTLKVKETDRVEALKNELAKMDYQVSIDDINKASFSGELSNSASIATYEDHRMAMSFAPLAMALGEIDIEEPMVVTKSYPNYWEDLKLVGFEVSPLD